MLLDFENDLNRTPEVLLDMSLHTYLPTSPKSLDLSCSHFLYLNIVQSP